MESKTSISRKKQNVTNLISQDFQEIDEYVEELEKFVEETFDPNNVENLKNQQGYSPPTDKEFNEIGEDSTNKEIKNKKSNKDDEIYIDQTKNKKT